MCDKDQALAPNVAHDGGSVHCTPSDAAGHIPGGMAGALAEASISASGMLFPSAAYAISNTVGRSPAQHMRCKSLHAQRSLRMAETTFTA